MTIVDILLYSLVGLAVVFFALCLLIVMIKILTWEKKAAPAPAVATASAEPAEPAAPKPLAPGTAGELKLYDTDPRDAAMIMAIVADELGKPLNELRFLSIKEVK